MHVQKKLEAAGSLGDWHFFKVSRTALAGESLYTCAANTINPAFRVQGNWPRQAALCRRPGGRDTLNPCIWGSGNWPGQAASRLWPGGRVLMVKAPL